MLTVFPLFTGINGYILLNEKKFVFFAVCTFIWAAILGVLRLKNRFSTPKAAIDSIDILIIIYMVAIVISTLHSEWPAFISISTGRCDGLVTYLLYGCILLGISRYGIARHEYIYVFAVSYSICCLIAVLQLLGFNPLQLYPNDLRYQDPFIQETGAFLGTLGNIDVFSALHCLGIPLFCGALVYRHEKWNYLLIVPIVLGFICMIAACVASGFLAGYLTVLLALPFLFQGKRRYIGTELPGKYAFGIGAVCSAVIFAVSIIVLYYGNWNTQTLIELQCVLHGDISETFGSNRIRIWMRTVEIIRKNLIFGIGPDNLWRVLDICFQRYSEILDELLITSIDNAHNEYLQHMVSFGLGGSLPIAGAQILTWVRVVQAESLSPTAVCLCFSLFCYLIQAFFNIGLCLVTPLFLIEWALLISSGRTAGG